MLGFLVLELMSLRPRRFVGMSLEEAVLGELE